MPELLEREELPEALIAPDEESIRVPPAPPDGLDTVLYEHDDRLSRRDLRLQIARMEKELGELFGAAFPRAGIDWNVPGAGGPRILAVDELERLRDDLAARIQHVRGVLGDRTYVEEQNRELIERMVANPADHRWVRVSNEDIGEPGCRHWHSRPQLGLVGLLMGWWRVKVSSGCPLAQGPWAPPDGQQAAAEKASAQQRVGWSARRRSTRGAAGRASTSTSRMARSTPPALGLLPPL